MCIPLEPDMWDVMKIVIPKVRPYWVKLAYSMGYDIYNVMTFEGGCGPVTINMQCYKLFENWLTTGCGCTPKTWQTLFHRIEQVDELSAAAEEIKRQLVEQVKQKPAE